MFSSRDSSDTFWVLACLALLVFAGVALSLMADNRFKISKGARLFKSELAADALSIESLTERVGAMKQELETAKATRSTEPLEERRVQREELAASARQLAGVVADLESELQALDEAYAGYRAEYRRTVWAAAVGESLGELRLRGGRVFSQAVVKLVTPVGLEIAHSEGLARIQAPELSPQLQDRFQWDAEERHAALEKEHKQGGQLAPRSAPTPVPAVAPAAMPAAPPAAAESAPADLASIRLRVSAWRVKVRNLREQVSEAKANARSGSRLSVPGSLETWQGRATRLEGELKQAELELTLARERLTRLSPGDPLLGGD
jgi:hypothetical protein